MKSIRILISDTHYGVKQNSITWLTYQLEFIIKQLIPFCQQLKKDKYFIRLYHLGDVFDSRSSINPLIANQVRDAYKKLYENIDEMFFIGGNHDYYCPNDDSVDSIHMVMYREDSFQPFIITKDIKIVGKDMLIPWYKYDDVDYIRELLTVNNIENVFVHADITQIDPEHNDLFKNVNVYSGHIHIPYHRNNLHNLGSTYAINFTDSNSDRGFYTLDEDNHLSFYPNNHSIRFHRIYNEDIFKDYDFNKNDYIEFYIDQSNLLNERYIKEIKIMNSKYHNFNVIPNNSKHNIDEIENIEQYNIEDICRQYIPKELIDKFNHILTLE